MVLQGPSARGRFLYGAAGNFGYLNHSVGPITADFKWAAGKRGSPATLPWPPKGVALTVRFRGGNTTGYRHFVVSITYEIFDGAPLMSKRLALEYSPETAAGSSTAGRRRVSADRGRRPSGQRRRGSQVRDQTGGSSLGWNVLGGVLAVADSAHGACLNNTYASGDNRSSQAVWPEPATSVSIAVAGWGLARTPAAPPADAAHGGIVLGLTSDVGGGGTVSLPPAKLDFWLRWGFSADGQVSMGQGASAPVVIGKARPAANPCPALC